MKVDPYAGRLVFIGSSGRRSEMISPKGLRGLLFPKMVESEPLSFDERMGRALLIRKALAIEATSGKAESSCPP